MKVFELHFNPKNKEEKVMASFVHEPTSTYEKRLGNLYMAGELTKAMPQNTNLLNNLASLIKKEHYDAGLKKTSQQSLQDSLKKANEFLDVEVRKGNVSWLGNLNFATINFTNFALNFTKIGDLKIFLIRNGEALEISQNLEYQETDPYPLKVFGNIATGKMSSNDKIVILNAKNESLIDDLSQISDEKGLKDFLRIKKQTLTESSGVCLLLIANEEKGTSKFAFQQTFKLPANPIKKLNISQGVRKRVFLILSLITVLALGFFIFR